MDDKAPTAMPTTSTTIPTRFRLNDIDDRLFKSRNDEIRDLV
jgi:hypothetical protein